MCIGYAFRPHLSSRLTRSGRTFLLKPEAFGHYDSHIILATHSGILTSLQSTRAFAHASPRKERSPTIRSCYSYLRTVYLKNIWCHFVPRMSPFFLHKCKNNNYESQASVYSLAPLHFRRRITRPVSYYALF